MEIEKEGRIRDNTLYLYGVMWWCQQGSRIQFFFFIQFLTCCIRLLVYPGRGIHEAVVYANLKVNVESWVHMQILESLAFG